MKPELTLVDLTKLSKYQRDKICQCEVPCVKAITITTYNDGMIICNKNAKEHMKQLSELLDEPLRRSWTKEEDQVIIDTYKNGSYHGIRKDIAVKLKNRTVSQVKNRTDQLKRKGLIS